MSDLLRSAYAVHLQSQSALAQMQASQQAMTQQAGMLNSIANRQYAPNVTPIKAGIAPPPPRTPEQIMEQLEKRYAELEAEANSPARKWPCKTCRFGQSYLNAHCSNPLVAGFSEREYIGEREKYLPALCGPEKALWEPIPPKRSLWARFIDWFAEPFRVPD